MAHGAQVVVDDAKGDEELGGGDQHWGRITVTGHEGGYVGAEKAGNAHDRDAWGQDAAWGRRVGAERPAHARQQAVAPPVRPTPVARTAMEDIATGGKL